MTFAEFIEMKVKEANDYACGVTDEEQCIAEDAWRGGKLEAAQHILDMWNEPWMWHEPGKFIERIKAYVEELK